MMWHMMWHMLWQAVAGRGGEPPRSPRNARARARPASRARRLCVRVHGALLTVRRSRCVAHGASLTDSSDETPLSEAEVNKWFHEWFADYLGSCAGSSAFHATLGA